MTTSNKPLFQHRHYVKIAEIIAALPPTLLDRDYIASFFSGHLSTTNPHFSADRFYAAAKGKPSNGRDKVQ